MTVKYGEILMGTLEHWHYDTFKAVQRHRYLGDDFVIFALDAAGRRKEMTLSAACFKRVA